MSSLAKTYEELTIHNVNQKTAHLAAEVGEYLLKIEDILSISLCCDDIELKALQKAKFKMIPYFTLFVKILQMLRKFIFVCVLLVIAVHISVWNFVL